MIDFKQVHEEIKRVKKIARPFAKAVAPIYRMLDWWWFRLGRPPDEDEIYTTIMHLLKNLEINEQTETHQIESGGIGLQITRAGDMVAIDIIMLIGANLIDAIQEL